MVKIINTGPNDPESWRSTCICSDYWDSRIGCGARLEVEFSDLWLSKWDKDGIKSDAWQDSFNEPTCWLHYWKPWLDKRTATYECPRCKQYNTVIVTEQVFALLWQQNYIKDQEYLKSLRED